MSAHAWLRPGPGQPKAAVGCLCRLGAGHPVTLGIVRARLHKGLEDRFGFHEFSFGHHSRFVADVVDGPDGGATDGRVRSLVMETIAA